MATWSPTSSLQASGSQPGLVGDTRNVHRGGRPSPRPERCGCGCVFPSCFSPTIVTTSCLANASFRADNLASCSSLTGGQSSRQLTFLATLRDTVHEMPRPQSSPTFTRAHDGCDKVELFCNSPTFRVWQNVNQAASPLLRCVSVAHGSLWLCECRVETQHQELKRGRGVSRAPMEPNNPLGGYNSINLITSHSQAHSISFHSVRLRHTRFRSRGAPPARFTHLPSPATPLADDATATAVPHNRSPSAEVGVSSAH